MRGFVGLDLDAHQRFLEVHAIIIKVSLLPKNFDSRQNVLPGPRGRPFKGKLVHSRIELDRRFKGQDLGGVFLLDGIPVGQDFLEGFGRDRKQLDRGQLDGSRKVALNRKGKFQGFSHGTNPLFHFLLVQDASCLGFSGLDRQGRLDEQEPTVSSVSNAGMLNDSLQIVKECLECLLGSHEGAARRKARTQGFEVQRRFDARPLAVGKPKDPPEMGAIPMIHSINFDNLGKVCRCLNQIALGNVVLSHFGLNPGRQPLVFGDLSRINDSPAEL
mmetsp:Transcript_220/g.481  ORF Transcript_220/g.481 Transcript_220/m.481 type:complete len:273 (+) Transcript_220:1191-2009(+)